MINRCRIILRIQNKSTFVFSQQDKIIYWRASLVDEIWRTDEFRSTLNSVLSLRLQQFDFSVQKDNDDILVSK